MELGSLSASMSAGTADAALPFAMPMAAAEKARTEASSDLRACTSRGSWTAPFGLMALVRARPQ
jgi:hypothetical protein